MLDSDSEDSGYSHLFEIDYLSDDDLESDPFELFDAEQVDSHYELGGDDYDRGDERLLEENRAAVAALGTLDDGHEPEPQYLYPAPGDFTADDIEQERARLYGRLHWFSSRLEASEARRYYASESQIQARNAMSAVIKHERAVDAELDLDRYLLKSYTATRPTNLCEAWARNDLEAVVQLASSLIERFASAPARYDLDDVQQLCAALRYRFRAYESMGLCTLAFADTKRLLKLIAEFGDNVDVEVDEDLLPASSHQEFKTNINSNRGSALNGGAEQGTKRPADTELGVQLVKRLKGGSRRLIRRSASIVQLPVEIILMIASFLTSVDCISLANTRTVWRSIPGLWQTLKFSRVKHTSAKGWQRDTIDACIAAIETCQRRSHGALVRVILKGYISERLVGAVLEALQPSVSTLQYLGIPTLDQTQCFKLLYKRCRNLEGIDIRIFLDPKEGGVLYGEHLSRATSLFAEKKLPFKLKTFVSSQDIDCGDITPHLDGIERLRGVRLARQKEFNFADAIVRAAPTLVEWQDEVGSRWDYTTILLTDYALNPEHLPKRPIVFPKLRKLSGFWSEHLIECEFPALLEARLNSLRGPTALLPVAQNNRLRIAAIISKSPLLKKLDVLLPTGNTALNQISTAISKLQKLEELGLWSTTGVSLQSLVEVQRSCIAECDDGNVVLPALRSLHLYSATVTPRNGQELERQLSELLLLRFYLTHGCKSNEARKRTRAALVGYDLCEQVMTKAQKKKLINTSARAAATTSYKGSFNTVNGLKLETFSPVLPKLVLSHGMSLLPGSESLLNQLVFEIAEKDTARCFEGSGSTRYYY